MQLRPFKINVCYLFWLAFIADESNTDYVQLFADRKPLQTVHIIYLVYIQSIWYAASETEIIKIIMKARQMKIAVF